MRQINHSLKDRPCVARLAATASCLLGLTFSNISSGSDTPFTKTAPAYAGSSVFQTDNPLAASSAPGNEGQEFLPVEQAYRLSTSLVDGTIQLQWAIAEGYYLYRHGFKVQLDQQDVTDLLALPEGIAREDELFGNVQVYYHQLALDLDVDLPSSDNDGYRLTVSSQGCADAGLCYPPHQEIFDIDSLGRITKADAKQPTGNSAPAANVVVDNTGLDTDHTQQGGFTLLAAVFFAFLGGLILNLMPCVLPVLSLKALGLASSGQSRKERIAHGWWYTTGIVVSFGAVAAMLIALKWAGTTVGWGFQLQSAWFVGALTYLFFVLAMLLIGAADFSGSWMGFGQALTSGGGYRGSFFTGALAVLVASPCTAPFMGTAMGFALTQSTSIALLVFCCLGFGMASPFLLLSYVPHIGSRLPAPGPWMERLRQFLAFPLLATALWLLWVIGRQAGTDAVTIVLGGCLLLAVALWFNGNKLPIQLVRLGLLTGALALLTTQSLKAVPAISSTPQQPVDSRYSATKVQQIQAEGKAVFINFTADWCITCKANENWVLSRAEIQQAFAHFDVTYLKADWTNRDPEIALALEQFGRSGIPLYLFYPASGKDGAIILPQILSIDLILETLQEHAAPSNETARMETANL